MEIIEHRIATRFGQTFSLTMTGDKTGGVAVYELKGHHAPEEVAATGAKWTEHEARVAGFAIPSGKHYRR